MRMTRSSRTVGDHSSCPKSCLPPGTVASLCTGALQDARSSPQQDQVSSTSCVLITKRLGTQSSRFAHCCHSGSPSNSGSPSSIHICTRRRILVLQCRCALLSPTPPSGWTRHLAHLQDTAVVSRVQRFSTSEHTSSPTARPNSFSDSLRLSPSCATFAG